MDQTAARPRVPFSYVLGSALGLWACYFVLATIRWEVLGLGFSGEMLWRRGLVSLAGVAVTLAMWLVLRLFDLRALWVKIVAALLIAVPMAVALAQSNYMIFAPMQDRILEQLAALQGVPVRRDESGNLLVDMPIPGLTSLPQGGEPEPDDGTAASGPYRLNPAGDLQATVQQLSDIALGRYFMLLAWAALYLALIAGAQARAAERREGEFRRAAKAAELRSLRYQVNPHFLFNTLNSLSALVLTGRKEQAEQMIQSLSSFYRHSLAEEPTADVSLAEEFALQRHYLEVEAVRFPERLQVCFDLPEALQELRVPGMILQPLVENSVKHAVAPSRALVTITLSARREAGALFVTVSDNGRAGSGAFAPTDGHGIGLSNVRQRLAARFGSAASLRAELSDAGHVTQLIIPLDDHDRN